MSKQEEMIKRIEELEQKVTALEAASQSVRDRGPSSTREMTDDDAQRIMLGDLKDTPHRKAAEALGLSYGQVYSARNGYTFKRVYNEMKQQS